ncbi:hypothetical protein GW17_00059717 [Ensete ventricosum]|nr:hypothetical protein GW17_00059717 [Ensete ventricosum]
MESYRDLPEDCRDEGIVSIAMDVEKSTVTIVGAVDAVGVVKALRKAKKPAEIVSVGEPDKKEEEEKKPEDSNMPPCCNACRSNIVWLDEPSACTIS